MIKTISKEFGVKFFNMFQETNGSCIGKITIKNWFFGNRKNSFFFPLFRYRLLCKTSIKKGCNSLEKREFCIFNYFITNSRWSIGFVIREIAKCSRDFI